MLPEQANESDVFCDIVLGSDRRTGKDAGLKRVLRLTGQIRSNVLLYMSCKQDRMNLTSTLPVWILQNKELFRSIGFNKEY